MVPVVLELGGKDPFIVLEDADLDRAVEGALAGVFVNCGQNCVAAERLLVHHSVAAELERRLQARVSALRQGPPGPGHVLDVGSMANEMQLRVVESQVREAVREGARLVCGGKRNTAHPGFFFEPTVLADVKPEMAIMRSETFGPVLLLAPFQDDAHAVRIANGIDYSLGASVFSRSRARARRVATQIKSGMVATNDFGGMTFMAPALTFGGVGGSGYGRLNGVAGMRACCQTRAVLEDRWPFGFTPPVFPTGEATYAKTQRALRWLYSPVGDLLRKLTLRS
jgi:acyl-CoA reductase-like NAD-dependent aldehyde dehydrogenase